MRAVSCLVLAVLLAVQPGTAEAMCGCRKVRTPRCDDPTAKHKVVVKIDLAADPDQTVEVITQSGPYHVPVADLDGKAVLFIFLPKGEVFNGFVEEAIPDSITFGAMQGATATIPTLPAFVPGEYELLLFVDAVPGGGIAPTRGDLAAFDNTVCDPTGVSVRVSVGCEDATVTLTNKHFIIF
jgi:hypothetical protein